MVAYLDRTREGIVRGVQVHLIIVVRKAHAEIVAETPLQFECDEAK